MSRTLISAAIAIILVVLPGRAQQQAPQPQRAPTGVSEGVTAVLVDVVMRDRRGQPVRDLTQADFQVLEDGVAQTIGSFKPVLADAATAAPASTAAAAAPSTGWLTGASSTSGARPPVSTIRWRCKTSTRVSPPTGPAETG